MTRDLLCLQEETKSLQKHQRNRGNGRLKKPLYCKWIFIAIFESVCIYHATPSK